MGSFRAPELILHHISLGRSFSSESDDESFTSTTPIDPSSPIGSSPQPICESPITMATAEKTILRVGYVPEHFSAPLHLAILHNLLPSSLSLQLIPFPSGTGHMIKSLESNSLDLAIGLTEGWIAALSNGSSAFKLVGEYVSSPLRWAISTGGKDGPTDVGDLKAEGGKRKRVGVSRVGSGSYVMSFVLAEQRGWLKGDSGEPFDFVVCDTFKGLRDGVNGDKADAFMWEYFTTKKYYDSKEIRQIGFIDTPWPSWHIVASTSSSVLGSEDGRSAVRQFLSSLNQGVKYFLEHQDEAVEWIYKNLDYSEEDAKEWLKTVEFSGDVGKVRTRDVVGECVEILRKAGVVGKEEVDVEGMVVKV